ncbi:MAG: hypothetical protein WHS46_00255 [Desulfosoma sp.]
MIHLHNSLTHSGPQGARRPKKRRSVAFLLLVFAFWVSSPSAQAGSVPELEARFLELTQALRSQPAQVLAALFPETSFPLQSLPVFQTLAVRGIPRLVLNEALTRTAEDTLQALVSQAEAGAVSFEIAPLSDRLAEHGYAAVEKGEIVTALIFRNFVQPEVAAEALFRDILNRELSTLELRRTVLLNPHVREVGLSCGAAKVTLHGVTHNAYVLVMVSGANVLHSLELHLFKELNRWRQNPGTGLFPVLLSAYTGTSAPWNLEPVPVLVWDSKLYEAAWVLGMGTQSSEGTVPRPTEAESSAWLPQFPAFHVSVPLDVSMGLEHLTAALWQAIVTEEAQRWVNQGGPYALSPWPIGGALHLFLHTAQDGTLFLDAVLLTASRPEMWSMESRLAGSVSLVGVSQDLHMNVQEVRLVSVTSQEVKAAALVDVTGGFSLLTQGFLYPPFTPYELVVVDAAGRELLRYPLPLGLDGGFVEVVLDQADE